MTPVERTRLRDLEEAATPGPFQAVDLNGKWEVSGPRHEMRPGCHGVVVFCEVYRREDAEFMAAARNSIVPLLDALEDSILEQNRIGDEAALIWGDNDALKSENTRLREALKYQHDAAYGENGATWVEALRRVREVLGDDLVVADMIHPEPKCFSCVRELGDGS